MDPTKPMGSSDSKLKIEMRMVVTWIFIPLKIEYRISYELICKSKTYSECGLVRLAAFGAGAHPSSASKIIAIHKRNEHVEPPDISELAQWITNGFNIIMINPQY